MRDWIRVNNRMSGIDQLYALTVKEGCLVYGPCRLEVRISSSVQAILHVDCDPVSRIWAQFKLCTPNIPSAISKMIAIAKLIQRLERMRGRQCCVREERLLPDYACFLTSDILAKGSWNSESQRREQQRTRLLTGLSRSARTRIRKRLRS